MESVLLDALVPPLVRETHPPDSHHCVDLHCVRGVRETPLTPLAVVVAKSTHPNHLGCSYVAATFAVNAQVFAMKFPHISPL